MIKKMFQRKNTLKNTILAILLWVIFVLKGESQIMTIDKSISKYGEDLTLFCQVDNCCHKTSGWEKWLPELKPMIFDIRRVNFSATFKFPGTVRHDGYTLTIRNVTKDDINKSYSCLYGFKRSDKKLLTEDDVFLGPNLEVVGKISNYGEDLKLFCEVKNCCKKSAAWEIWDPSFRTIIKNIKDPSNDVFSKYKANLDHKGYSLIIKNVTVDDLNRTYSCLYGFTRSNKQLLLKNDVFKIEVNLPKKDRDEDINEVVIIFVVFAVVLVAVVLTVTFIVWLSIRRRNNTIQHPEEAELLSTGVTLVKKNIQKVTECMKCNTEMDQLDLEPNEDQNIPENIREHIKLQIKDWKMEDTTFVETRAADKVSKLLQSENCVIVTGSSGTGKSFLIHHAALQLHYKEKYDIITAVKKPSRIIDYYNPKRKQVFVVDDIFGANSVNIGIVNQWDYYMKDLEPIFKDKNTKEQKVQDDEKNGKDELFCAKLLVSCRLHIYKDPQLERLTLFKNSKNCTCNLMSENNKLLPEEKLAMVNKYISDETVKEIMLNVDSCDFFPLLCKLSVDKTKEAVQRLFSKPAVTIKENIEGLKKQKHVQYHIIAMCVLLDNNVQISWFDLKEAPLDIQEALNHICREFKIDLELEETRQSIEENIDILVDTFLKKSGDQYSMIHDKIYDIAAVICGKHLTECFINYASSTFIGDRFRFLSVSEELKSINETTEKGQDEFEYIPIKKHKEKKYFERLVRDLKRKNIYSTLYNNQLKSEWYRKLLLTYLKNNISSDSKLFSEMKEIAIDKTNEESNTSTAKTTPLIEATKGGYQDIVEYLIEMNCDIIGTNDVQKSSLNIASEEGHKRIVELLLAKKAEINQCDKWGRSPLYIACKRGHIEIVELLLENNADVNLCEKSGESPLFAACEGGHKEIVKLLVDKEINNSHCESREGATVDSSCDGRLKGTQNVFLNKEAEINQPVELGETPLLAGCEGENKENGESLTTKKNINRCNLFSITPLHVACERGDKAIAKVLLDGKADISRCTDFGETPLYVACKGGHEETVKLLLYYKADTSYCDKNGKSPLYVACHRGHKQTVKLLLDSEADINQCDKSGMSPLHAVCERGHTEIADLLLENKADINQFDKRGKSPLYLACKGGHKETTKLLLDKNADISHGDARGKAPLLSASGGKYREPVELFLKTNADISRCVDSIETPLHVACKGGHKEIAEQLIYNEVNIDQCNSLGETPLYVSCKVGNEEIVELLLDHDADINQCTDLGESPLYVTCKGGHEEIVKLLLDNEADINQCTNVGESPLYAACKVGHTKIADLLLKNNADINQCVDSGQSSLYTACKGGHTSTVKLLIDTKAKINQYDKREKTPLFVACKGGHKETVKILLYNNADINKCETKGKSPLFVACKGGHKETIEILLDNNADINKCDKTGKSPLYVACKGRHRDIVKLLLDNQADISQCDRWGRSPLDVARTMGLELPLSKANCD